jgi:predicted restriction endonuclease
MLKRGTGIATVLERFSDRVKERLDLAMVREGDFSRQTKRAAIERQKGLCAFCGLGLETPWSNGEYRGYAHHLRPLHHGGSDTLANCVYLCWAHHQLIGHGMAPIGIDKQGGSSRTWIQMSRRDFAFWQGGQSQDRSRAAEED